MNTKFAYAREGYKWQPTEKADGRITAKYKDGYSNKKQYENQVPERWIREELVKEVPI